MQEYRFNKVAVLKPAKPTLLHKHIEIFQDSYF